MITGEGKGPQIIRRIGRFIAGRLPHIPLPVLRADVLSFLDEMGYRAEPIGRDKDIEDANEFYASGIA